VVRARPSVCGRAGMLRLRLSFALLSSTSARHDMEWKLEFNVAEAQRVGDY
jgi:hypothetical protein